MSYVLRQVLEHKGRVVYTVRPEDSVQEAVRVMSLRNVGAVLVVSEGELAGIFTERDVLRRLVGQSLDPCWTPVAEIMTSDVVVVSLDTTVEEAMALCTERRIRHLPVVDNGQVVGLISAGDLTRWQVVEADQKIHELNDYIWGPWGRDDTPPDFHPARMYPDTNRYYFKR